MRKGMDRQRELSVDDRNVVRMARSELLQCPLKPPTEWTLEVRELDELYRCCRGAENIARCSQVDGGANGDSCERLDYHRIEVRPAPLAYDRGSGRYGDRCKSE